MDFQILVIILVVKNIGESQLYLFHSIAARINNHFYCENYKEIWDFIKQCCSMLPCPYCRNHAVFYTNQIKLNDVNKKEKLIRVCLIFIIVLIHV